MSAKVHILFVNGSTEDIDKPSFMEALTYAREKVSYSSGKVQRVEIRHDDGISNLWDASWSEESRALLWKDRK